jgi:hypothetical protein
MADLIDRLSGEDGEKINLHRFIGAERLYALGEVTGAEIVADFALEGDALTQATTLKNKIDSYTDAQAKALYILRVESVCMCIEDDSDTLYHTAGVVNKTKVLEDLQFT